MSHRGSYAPHPSPTPPSDEEGKKKSSYSMPETQGAHAAHADINTNSLKISTSVCTLRGPILFPREMLQVTGSLVSSLQTATIKMADEMAGNSLT